MELNDKKLRRTSAIINWTIAIVLAIFLCLLGNNIIMDLDRSVTYPSRSAYVDNNAELKLGGEYNALDAKISVLRQQQDDLSKMIELARENKDSEQQSFDNWIKTRSTLGSPKDDPEVLKRIYEIDRLSKVQQSWQASSDSLDAPIGVLMAQQDIIEKQQDILSAEADSRYYKAVNSYEVRVFFIRLLFVGPILALGIFFFLRFRKKKFAPLYMGFSLFSVYAFFVGLVPYLPSYGGYIRYVVGILLTAGLGYYAIKKIRAYADRKRKELEESTKERADKLQADVIEKAYNNHFCPSCGKDYLLKPWEPGVKYDEAKLMIVSTYCKYCGLELMKKCRACNHPNFAYLPYCVECGTKLKE